MFHEKCKFEPTTKFRFTGNTSCTRNTFVRTYRLLCLCLIIITFSLSSSGCAPFLSSSNLENTFPSLNSAPGETQATDVISETKVDQPTNGLIGDFFVVIKEFYVTENYADEAILVVTYAFTNNDDEPRAFIYSIEETLFQNGVELGDVYVAYGIDGYDFDNKSKQIKSGVTLDVQVAYELNDKITDVEVEIKEMFSFNGETLTYTISLDDQY